MREAAPSDGQCPVCLIDLSSEEKCTRMPCGHCFHEHCLLQWLRSHNTCPVCRFAVEPTEAPRPTPLSTVLQNWHERMRAEQAAAASAEGSSTAAPSAAAPSDQGAGRALGTTTRSTRSNPAPASLGESSSSSGSQARSASRTAQAPNHCPSPAPAQAR